MKFIQTVTRQSNIYGEALKNSYDRGNNFDNYPNSPLGRQLQVASSLIKGGLESKIYMANLGGFDTHKKQVDSSDNTKGEHANLMKDLNNSIGSLFQDLDQNAQSEDVLVMTYSEFGRTIVSNGSLGTDHGTAAPMFVFGNKVDFNISGKNPDIPTNVVWQDNLEAEFDFRQVYYSVIKQWLGGNQDTAENTLFKNFDQIPIVQSRYIDTDGDGVSDDQDQCNSTPSGSIVNTSGCEIFSLLPDNYSIQTNGVSCEGKSNGQIIISVQDTSHVYNISIPETSESYVLNSSNQHRVQIDGLGIGNYTINISIEGEEEYLQTFEIGITQPGNFSSKTSINKNQKKVSVNLSGSEMYLVELNGVIQIQKQNKFELSLLSGYNSLKISTPHDCQGTHKEEIFISEQVEYYPNPMVDDLTLVIPGDDQKSQITIYTRSGIKIKTLEKTIPQSRMVRVNVSGLPKDIYVIKVKGTTVDKTFKVQKK